jgi:hypothetical protein
VSPVPIDLPTNEMYLWAVPNIEFRRASTPLNAFGAYDESLLLFWSSTRSGVDIYMRNSRPEIFYTRGGVPDLYAGAIQPNFYISPFDFDAD